MPMTRSLPWLLLCALAVTAQTPQITRVQSQMIRWQVPAVVPPGTNPAYAVMILPSGAQSLVVIGPGLALDLTVTPPVLKAIATTPPPVMLYPVEKTIVCRVTDPAQMYAVADANYEPASLAVYRNGLLMASPDDYSVASLNVTFVPAQAPQMGDIVQLKYRLK